MLVCLIQITIPINGISETPEFTIVSVCGGHLIHYQWDIIYVTIVSDCGGHLIHYQWDTICVPIVSVFGGHLIQYQWDIICDAYRMKGRSFSLLMATCLLAVPGHSFSFTYRFPIPVLQFALARNCFIPKLNIISARLKTMWHHVRIIRTNNP